MCDDVTTLRYDSTTAHDESTTQPPTSVSRSADTNHQYENYKIWEFCAIILLVFSRVACPAYAKISVEIPQIIVVWDLLGSGPEGPELEGKQADRKFKATNTRRKSFWLKTFREGAENRRDMYIAGLELEGKCGCSVQLKNQWHPACKLLIANYQTQNPTPSPASKIHDGHSFYLYNENYS